MHSSEIAHQRLRRHQIADVRVANPHELVAWMAAIQAQDYLGAPWAIGLWTPDASEGMIEDAIANKTIIRTSPMRGILHFVAAEDVKGMLDLLTPRVPARSADRRQHLGLDKRILDQSKDVLSAALHGGKQLPRRDLFPVLEAAHIATSAQRGSHIVGFLRNKG